MPYPIAFENTPTRRHSTSSVGETTTARCPGAPTGRQHERADRQSDAEPGDAAADLRDPRADDDVRRPHRRGDEDAQHPDGVVADLDAAQHDHAADRQHQREPRCGRCGSVAAATAIGPMNSIATLLPRSVRSIAM